jgi:hypothetical protein
MCASYQQTLFALKYIEKLECSALAVETGSKLTSDNLAKMYRLCLLELGT